MLAPVKKASAPGGIEPVITRAEGPRDPELDMPPWFFNQNNVEIVVKVLNGCIDPFNSYWVFAAGLTNVGVDLTVTDMLHGETKAYSNPIGTAFPPIQDTAAFGTCP